MARRDKDSNDQNSSNASTSKKYWLLLLLFIPIAFGVSWLLRPSGDADIPVKPKQNTDIQDTSVNEKPEDNEPISKTPELIPSPPSTEKKGTNKSTNRKKDESEASESPEPPIVEEPTTSKPPVVEEETKVFPPAISSAKLESSINNLYELRVGGGADGPDMLENEIEKIASMLAPGAKISYKSSLNSNSIGLPKELKKYLREVGLLYKEEKFIIESFQYDPTTGKIVGFTLCKTK